MIVVDDFYADETLAFLRKQAAELPFQQYLPRRVEFREFPQQGWLWNSSKPVLGEEGPTVPRNGWRGKGFREEVDLAGRLDAVLPVRWSVCRRSLAAVGSGWTGVLHSMNERLQGGPIHDHILGHDLRPDVPDGYAGTVYLNEPSPEKTEKLKNCGVSFWRSRVTGKATEEAGHARASKALGMKPSEFRTARFFELIFELEARANRLVLFQGSLLHRIECGFGDPNGPRKDTRLSQTVFFNITKISEGGQNIIAGGRENEDL